MEAMKNRKIFNLPFQVAKKIQADIKPGLFLNEWKRLEHSLSQTRGLLAKTMHDSMKQR